MSIHCEVAIKLNSTAKGEFPQYVYMGEEPTAKRAFKTVESLHASLFTTQQLVCARQPRC